MEEVYKLNQSVSVSDRKYSYSKVSAYLRKQQIEKLELSDEHGEIYSFFSSHIDDLNKAMFTSKADFHSIISSLNRIHKKVIDCSKITEFLQRYISMEIFPKLAYCHYKLGQNSIAEDFIKQHFAVGNILINQKAYFLLFNLFEQILNLNKVLVAQNKIEQCIFNWKELFKFLILGGESGIPYLSSNADFINTGLYKVLKEYSILNFLKVYIGGHLQYGIYPQPNIIFSDWYAKMDVDSSERLAIFRYITLLESFDTVSFDKLSKEIVEFTHVFDSSNFLILRFSLIEMLIKRIMKENLPSREKSEMTDFLKNSLKTIGSKNGLATYADIQ